LAEGDRMKKNRSITTLFLDIGGVLLANGWDHHARKRAATNFKPEVAVGRGLPAMERTGI